LDFNKSQTADQGKK